MNNKEKLELAIRSLKSIANHEVRQNYKHRGMVDMSDIDDLQRMARITLTSIGEDED